MGIIKGIISDAIICTVIALRHLSSNVAVMKMYKIV